MSHLPEEAGEKVGVEEEHKGHLQSSILWSTCTAETPVASWQQAVLHAAQATDLSYSGSLAGL